MELARQPEAYFDRRADKVRDLPDGEIDALIDEAVDDVRHSRT